MIFFNTKECLKIIKILEEKLNEAEYKCSQFLNQENESTEYEVTFFF